MKEIRLSVSGLKQAALIDQSEFTFIVGKEEAEFRCARFQAGFISKKVCNLLSSDPTLDRLRILPDRDGSCFRLIECLWNGATVHVDTSDINDLMMLSQELENDELTRLLLDLITNGEISNENCLSRLHTKQKVGLDCTEEIEFIASRFFRLDVSFIKSLGINCLEQILQHSSLKLDSESALLDLIVELAVTDVEYYSLLRYIRIEFLDVKHVADFMDVVYPDRIDSFIWESLRSLLLDNWKGCERVGKQRYRMQKTLWEYDSSSPMNGIFSYLKRKSRRNPHLTGEIEITASSTANTDNPCHGVLNYGWNFWWCTNDSPNSWIQFDFKKKTISLDSYTIKTRSDGGTHIKEWKVEASNDLSDWITIDARDTDVLNGNWFAANFKCPNQQTQAAFRYIRLMLTGPTWSNNHRLLLSEIEFFGSLSE